MSFWFLRHFCKFILQTFSEAVRFNVVYGVFEVVNNAPQLLEKQLKKILLNQRPRNPIYDVVRKGKSDVKPVQVNAPHEDETINVNYNIMVRKYIWVTSCWINKALNEIIIRFLGHPFLKCNCIY